MSKRIFSGSTKDYNLFLINKNNRQIDIAQVQTLVGAIQERDNISSISCIETKIDGKRKLAIIDGQHRFLALKRLQKEIEYDIWNIDANSMIMLNETQSPWKLIDYLDYGVTEKNSDYIEINNYLKTTGIKLQSLLLIFSRSSDLKNLYLENEIIKDFKKIIWRIRDINYAKKTLNKILELYQDFRITHYNSHRFICSFLDIITHPEFDYKRMKSQLQRFSFKLKRQISIADYIDNFEKVYNHDLPSKDWIIFPKNAFDKAKNLE